MNRVIQFLGVLLTGFIIWAAVDFDGLRDAVRHYYRAKSVVTAPQGADTQRAEAQRNVAESESHLIELKAQGVEMSLGKSAAMRYRTCHTNPPSTEQQKKECEELDARFRAEEAKTSKRPL